MALKESLHFKSDHQIFLYLEMKIIVSIPKGIFSFENILIALAAKVPTKANIIRLKVT